MSSLGFWFWFWFWFSLRGYLLNYASVKLVIMRTLTLYILLPLCTDSFFPKPQKSKQTHVRGGANCKRKAERTHFSMNCFFLSSSLSSSEKNSSISAGVGVLLTAGGFLRLSFLSVADDDSISVIVSPKHSLTGLVSLLPKAQNKRKDQNGRKNLLIKRLD